MQPEQKAADNMDIPPSFVHHFWSKDKSGMNKLMNYIKFTHEDLDKIYTIYIERAQIEQEFGEKLAKLAEKNNHEKEQEGIPAAYDAITMELKSTANAHLDLADKLQQELAIEFEAKLDEYRLLLEKWTKSLDELYHERLERTMELLKTRAKYLKEHELAKGQTTPAMESLKSHYKTLVSEVDEVAQEWNSVWKEACEVMEAMEEDRVEFLKSNVWEYANLTSATLLIQDEWCENIRKQLERCNVDVEIEKCISLYGTGSKIPTTNEYVSELMREQKKRHQTQSEKPSKAPTPPSKPSRQQEKPGHQPMEQQAPSQRKSKEYENSEGTSTLPRQSQRHHDEQQETNTSQRQQRTRDIPSDQDYGKKQRSAAAREEIDQRSYERNSNSPNNNQINTIQKNVSSNMGSTATRGQIKRKPLNKSLMEQVSNEMAMARQQREMDQQQNSKSSTVNSKDSVHNKVDPNGSLESLLKTFEGNSSGTASPDSIMNNKPSHPEAPVSEEARSRRQPSEYKPDEGSLPSRRTNAARQLKDNVDDLRGLDKSQSPNMIQKPAMHPVVAPKSPRPAPQQISLDKQQPSETYTDQQRHQVQQTPTPTNRAYDAQEHHSYPYMPHQQYPVGQSPYMGHPHQQQQHMSQPQRSPNMQPIPSPIMQPQRSPMMQPQRSPMMQPQRSPMMQSQRSPMMQPMHSPMMQPMHSPMMQPVHSPMLPPAHSPMMQAQRSPMMTPSPLMQPQPFGTQRSGTLPPPITIPTTNFATTPQPSPSMSYANLGGVSPGGILPPPASPLQTAPKPHQYSDGQPIQFWARAKYDYEANDSDELSFKAHNLIGVLEADITQQSWWLGAIWDEYKQTWSAVGSIPSNFMESC